MSNVKFQDYLREQLKDQKFKVEFQTERADLENAVTMATLGNQNTNMS